jgi:hypothetical protein
LLVLKEDRFPNVTEPCQGFIRPIIILRSVVFPDPLGPSNPKNCPL